MRCSRMTFTQIYLFESLFFLVVNVFWGAMWYLNNYVFDRQAIRLKSVVDLLIRAKWKRYCYKIP